MFLWNFVLLTQHIMNKVKKNLGKENVFPFFACKSWHSLSGLATANSSMTCSLDIAQPTYDMNSQDAATALLLLQSATHVKVQVGDMLTLIRTMDDNQEWCKNVVYPKKMSILNF